MTGPQAVLQLESMGCCFSLTPEGKIHTILPGNRTGKVEELIEIVKANRAAAALLLNERALGATVAIQDKQVLNTRRYFDIKALKLAQDAGDIEVTNIIYHRRTGAIEAVWRPVTPLPFLDLDKHKQTLESRMEALLMMEPTPEVVAEYNLLAL